LPVIAKLGGQVLAAILLISLGLQVRLFSNDWVDWAITLVWLVGITNAFNFVDSMDGLATGLGSMSAAFFMLVTYDSMQMELSLFSALLFGACVGSFYHNSMPARYFLGDSGAQLLGFVLAALAIAYTPIGFIRLQSWFVPILLLAVPIFDTALVVLSRLRRGRPIYKANLDHTYHRLVRLGMSCSRAVMTMHVAAMLLGCLAFVLLPIPPIWGNSVFAACVITGALGILILDNRRFWP
jgi:UDP-GlcNAc:undecaprenyl-phosphate/decaprenyl-phosphate GlcNAc-1-phosphate transferase